MKASGRLGVLLAGCAIASAGAWAQISIPNLPPIVQLPTEDFVWTWGEPRSADDPEDPDFSVDGVEGPFRCTLNGTFRPGSRMRDYFNLREFEDSLTFTITFIQDATARLNSLFLANELQWAVMNCAIVETPESEAQQQQRLDRALERAERERERRRARAEEESEEEDEDSGE